MGIGNRRHRSDHCVAHQRSLPLMGIGNGSRQGEPRREGVPHYPSWGSGTSPATPPGPPGASPHYPSWGSGTGPHPSGSTAWSTSLPLMGIGNWRCTSPSPTLCSLITPHGDRERGFGFLRYDLLVHSLPLMGIGNSEHPRTDVGGFCGSLPLMGIGNDREHGQRHAQRESHYPSWGSGTARTSPGDSTTIHSLPLMGIGNASRASPARRLPTAHYPSWGSGTRHRSRARTKRGHTSLPLMGIGNCVPRRIRRRRLTLITPHGDREPDTERLSRVRIRTHYPSWGSGTSAAASRRRLGAPSHYPSWGSGTSGRKRQVDGGH